MKLKEYIEKRNIIEINKKLIEISDLELFDKLALESLEEKRLTNAQKEIIKDLYKWIRKNYNFELRLLGRGIIVEDPKIRLDISIHRDFFAEIDIIKNKKVIKYAIFDNMNKLKQYIDSIISKGDLRTEADFLYGTNECEGKCE